MAGERVRTRLAAILEADIAGYSHLMNANEEGTFVSLRAHRRQVIDPKIAERCGRIAKIGVSPEAGQYLEPCRPRA